MVEQALSVKDIQEDENNHRTGISIWLASVNQFGFFSYVFLCTRHSSADEFSSDTIEML